MANTMQQEDQFYYKTPELTHRYELIQHLLEYSNHLILVQGEKDTGKTSLFNQLTTPDESSLLITRLEASAHTNQSDILNAMVADMNASTDSFDPWGTSIEDFHNWLGRCHSKQQIPALLIDDIDLLDDELLDFIFNELCAPHEDTALHVCLFCEPSFLELARKKGLEENESQSLHIIEMPHFNEKQTAQYLNHKFPDSESDLSVFDEKTVKQIHRISHGMPGRINVLAEQYLNDPAKVEPDQKIEATLPEQPKSKPNRAIIIVVVLLVILSAVMAYLLNMSDLTLTNDSAAPAEIVVELPEQETTVVETDTGKEEITSATDDTGPQTGITTSSEAAEVSVDIQPLQAEEETTIASDETTPKIEVIEPAGQAPTPMPEPAEPDTAEPDTAATAENTQDAGELDTIQDIDIETSLAATTETMLADDSLDADTDENLTEIKSQAVSEIPLATDLLITGIDSGEAVSDAQTDTPAAPTVEQQATSTTQDPANSAENDKQDIDWLLQQDQNRYVLQLIGAYEQPTIDAYLRSLPELAEQTIGFTTTNEGRDWYVVVYGLYDNRQQAVTAIQDLPEKARATSPWPRPVKSIKALILKR